MNKDTAQENRPHEAKVPNFFAGVLQSMLNDTSFWTHPSNPLNARLHINPESNVFVVVGDNACGKSFFVDTARTVARNLNPEVSTVSISIRERTGSGTDPMAAMRRAMMFGDEQEQSTGAISAGMIQKGFNNLQSRLEDGKNSVLVLDEPELGLSETFHAAVGAFIAQLASQTDPQSGAAVIVSHSRRLVRALMQHTKVPLSAVVMGDHQNLAQWLEDAGDKSIDDLLALKERNRDNHRKLDSIFKEIRQKNSKPKSPGLG